jgi:hypothetical protein
MRRRAWDVLAGGSLLLLVAAAVMWACSERFYDETGLRVGRQTFGVDSAAGDTSWVWDTDFTSEPRSYARRVPLKGNMYADGMAHYLEHRFAGFGFRYRYDGAGKARGTTFRVLVVPYWFLLVATAAAPAYWVMVTRRRRRRVVAGMCAGCGYDLRVSTGRCPECGKEF